MLYVTNPFIADEFAIHEISYLWYTLVGTTITIVVAVIVSFIIGPNKPHELDPNLLAPFVRRMIKPRAPETANIKTDNIISIAFREKEDKV